VQRIKTLKKKTQTNTKKGCSLIGLLVEEQSRRKKERKKKKVSE